MNSDYLQLSVIYVSLTRDTANFEKYFSASENEVILKTEYQTIIKYNNVENYGKKGYVYIVKYIPELSTYGA